MSSKAALKAVRSALDAKQFGAAAEQAQSLVAQDPQNYHAYVEELNRSEMWLIEAYCVFFA